MNLFSVDGMVWLAVRDVAGKAGVDIDPEGGICSTIRMPVEERIQGVVSVLTQYAAHCSTLEPLIPDDVSGGAA